MMNTENAAGCRRAGRCVVITAYIESPIAEAWTRAPGDFVICADGGYAKALAEGIRPNAAMGDFDSLGYAPDSAAAGSKSSIDAPISAPAASGIQPAASDADMRPSQEPQFQSFTFPKEKGDTDTLLCLKHGAALGFTDFLIVGGIGGRLDHTLANLQSISWCLDRGFRAWMADGSNRATMSDGQITLDPEAGFFFSILAWSGSCAGVRIENAKYTLNGEALTSSMPLGVSNEFIGRPAVITQKSGRLLIILSKDST